MMSEEAFHSADFQYRLQLRGAIVMVAFQLFAVLFFYLLSWNYHLIQNSLTPMFWSVLFAVALHGPKTSMVEYCIQYDKRLAQTISPWIESGHKWRIPTCILTFFCRIFLFWRPILFDVKYHARKYSKSNLFVNYSSSPSGGAGMGTFSFHRRPSTSDYKMKQFSSITSDDAHDGDDDMDSDLSDLSAEDTPNQTPKVKESNKSTEPRQTLKDKLTSSVSKAKKTLQRAEKRGEQVIGDGAQKVVRVGSWLMSPTGLFCSLFICLIAILLGSEVVDKLGLYALFRGGLVVLVVMMGIAAIFVLIPKWSKQTYNTVVVVFLILTLICAGTLISGVLLFKIADEMTRFVRLMNQVVDQSEVFKDLHLDSYLNATSSKVLESLQIHLGPEMNEKMIQKILSNDHGNWMETFYTLFGGDATNHSNHSNASSIDVIHVHTVNDNEVTNDSDSNISNSVDASSSDSDTTSDQIPTDSEVATVDDGEEGLMAEIYKVITFQIDFDMMRMLRKAITACFGEQEWINAVKNVDVMKYVATAQEWGLDLPFINNLFGYTKQITALVSANLFGIVGILLSFGSWIISLGLDFMVFLACLFYLLVESEEVFDTINNIASVIPSSDSPNQSAMTFYRHFSVSGLQSLSNREGNEDNEPHFMLKLFKSIQDIFVVTFEIFLCHAFVTWFTFTICGVDFSFVTAFTSGVLSVIPYFPPWVVCIHGVIYLCAKHNFVAATFIFVMHVCLMWIDPMLMERIEYAHPYATGMSIILGLTQFGLNGAIIGPLLVCLTTWSLEVIGFYCKQFATVDTPKKAKKKANNSLNSIRGGSAQRLSL